MKRVFGNLSYICVSVLALVLPASTLQAQDFQQVAPKLPGRTLPGQVPPGQIAAGPGAMPASDAQADDTKLILPSLKGLRFVAHVDDVVKNGITSNGIDVSAVPVLNDPALVAQLQSYIGKRFTFGDLHAINRTVIDWQRAHDRPLVDVAVPDQDVSTGTVQIVVTEFTFEKVKVAGNKFFDTTIFAQGIEAAPGEAIDLDLLKRDLDWLNRNPFRKVDAVLARGGAIGTTDIQVNVDDRLPLRVYASYDNSGTVATGRGHWSLGVNYANLFGADQQISYQLTGGDDTLRKIGDGTPRYLANSLSYTVPLSWHDLLEIFGSYVRQSPNAGPFFDQVGKSGQISARYVHPMGGPAWLSQELQLGFDYKTTNNNLAFGGEQVFGASQDVDQFLLIYTATAVDGWGVTTIENDLVYSPGGMTNNNKDASFARSGTSFANARYVYDTIAVTRATQLPYDTSSITRLKGQISDGDLLPSEQLGGGGVDSVRGYDTRVVNGSEGILASEELRSPPFGLLNWTCCKDTNDSAQFLAFWDYARLSDPHTQTKAPDHIALESVGAGLNYMIGRYVDLRFDYGWQLLDLPGSRKHGQMADVSLTLGD
jgi:hemolysin activation/secretion protein